MKHKLGKNRSAPENVRRILYAVLKVGLAVYLFGVFDSFVIAHAASFSRIKSSQYRTAADNTFGRFEKNHASVRPLSSREFAIAGTAVQTDIIKNVCIAQNFQIFHGIF